MTSKLVQESPCPPTVTLSSQDLELTTRTLKGARSRRYTLIISEFEIILADLRTTVVCPIPSGRHLSQESRPERTQCEMEKRG